MLQICKIIYFQQLTRPPQASNLGLRKFSKWAKRTNRNKKWTAHDTLVSMNRSFLHPESEEEETRTPTSQLTLPPQSSASTNSATSPARMLVFILTTLSGQGRIRTAEAAKQQIYSLPVLTTYLPTLKMWYGIFNHEKSLISEMRMQRYNFFCNLQTFWEIYYKQTWMFVILTDIHRFISLISASTH